MANQWFRRRRRVCQRLSHVEGFRLRRGGRHGSIIGRGFVGHVDGQVGARGATPPTSSTGITESLTKTNLVAVMPRCFFLFKTLFAFQ
jgi:hypothetical protein